MNEPKLKLTIEIAGGRAPAKQRIEVNLEAWPELGNLASIFNDLVTATLTSHEGYIRSADIEPASLAIV